MTKRNIIIIGTFFLLLVVIFTGIFIAVLGRNNSVAINDKQEKFYYNRAVDLYKNGSYIDAESALKELNSKFPKSKYTEQANIELKDIKEKADKARLEKPAKDAEYDAKQAKIKQEYEDAEAEARKTFATNVTETQEAFNKVFSVNKFRAAYAGVQCKRGNHLIVYVNDLWNIMSKDRKIAFITTCVTAWGGIANSHNTTFNPDEFNLEVKHSDSNRTVGTWGSIRGPVIKD